MRNSNRKTLSRRALLGAATALGGSYWLRRPDSLPLANAQNGDAPPRRLVIFHTGEGTLRDRWAPSGSETDFTFGELQNEWLTKFIPDLVVMNGLAMLSNDADPTPAASAHDAGNTHSLTGIKRASPSLPKGPSIDTTIANELTKAGVLTKLPSLQLSTWALSGPLTVSFLDDGSPAPFLWNPTEAYDRCFGDFVAPDDPAGQSQVEQREMLLKWASAEYGKQATHLAGGDRLKLEAHGDLLRDLQRRLSLGAGCAPPELDPFPPGGQDEVYNYILDAQMRMAVSALACDLTRVITIGCTEVPAADCGYTAGLAGTSDLHDLIHKTAENGELKNDVAAVAPIVKFHQANAKSFGQLLEMLAATPERDGTTLLQNTIVLWAGQLGSGSHDLHQLPWMLAGQGGGYLKTGRYLDWFGSGKEPPHNNLFVSLANYMGVEMESFGDPDICTGQLEGLVV